MAEPIQCQVCGRALVPLKDGTSRRHTPRRPGTGGEANEYARCKGSGHRLARWPVGQRLRHHAGSEWEIAEDRAPHGYGGGDYLIRCVAAGPWSSEAEQVGVERIAHGEYMHRNGWIPVEPLPDSGGGHRG